MTAVTTLAGFELVDGAMAAPARPAVGAPAGPEVGAPAGAVVGRPPGAPPRANLLWITVDSLRHDRAAWLEAGTPTIATLLKRSG